MALLNQWLETCATLTKKVRDLEKDKIAQAIKITKLKQRVRRLEKKRKLKASGLKRLRKVRSAQRVESSADTVMDDQEDASKQGEIVELDADEDVSLEEVEAKKEAEVQGRRVLEVVIAAKLMTKVVTTATTPITVAPVPKASAPRRRRSVPVVDYQIHIEHNIIRADETHQLFLSFISLLRNFNREDLEMLWKIVQERFASLEPKNFLDDFMLNAIKTMFEKPNVEDSIWKNQRGRYGLEKVKS
nr:hypothetical protein [Tanacetum cinerariifolium]